MIIKKPLTRLTTSLLLASFPTISLSDSNNDPVSRIEFIDRRINEWSIGVSNPDYTYYSPTINYREILPDYEFKHLVTFGDSLSDQGMNTRSTMFLAGGYHSRLYNDYLSQHYTGKISAPSSAGGLNYAQAGTSFKDRGGNIYIRYQIDSYLKDSGGMADPDSIYIINAGGMDINKSFAKIVENLIKGTYHFTDEFYTIDDSPQLAINDINYLSSKGAKHIMIGNVPDASLAPYTPMIPLELVTYYLFDNLHLPNFGLITHVGKLIDNRLRNPSHQIQANNNKEMIRVNGIQSLQSMLWFLPRSTTTMFYDFFAKLERVPTQQFNNSLEFELKKLGKDVVFFDFRKLMSEVIDDHKGFGFDEILVPTCDLGFSSRYCDYDSNRYHKDKVYLFGDWFHPSPEAHFLAYQYIQSVFDAPLYVTTLGEHFSNLNKTNQNFLESQLFSIKQTTDKELNQWYLITGYSGSINDTNYQKYRLDSKKNYIHSLNIGTYTFNSPNMALGIILSTALGKQTPFTNFRYRYVAPTVNLFSQWSSDNGLWLNTTINLGYVKIQDIERNIQLRTHQRTEKTSSTNAYSIGANVKGSYDWINQESFQSGPQAVLNLNRTYVKGFREEGSRSTSMHFEPYHKDNFYAGLGWYVNSKNYQLGNASASFKAQIDYNQAIGKKNTVVRGAVNSTKTSFTRKLTQPKQWINMQLNANIRVAQYNTINTNISFMTDKEKNKKISYGLGYSYQF